MVEPPSVCDAKSDSDGDAVMDGEAEIDSDAFKLALALTLKERPGVMDAEPVTVFRTLGVGGALKDAESVETYESVDTEVDDTLKELPAEAERVTSGVADIRTLTLPLGETDRLCAGLLLIDGDGEREADGFEDTEIKAD